MDPQVGAAIVGAGVGAFLTAIGAFVLWFFQDRSASRRAVRDARVSCAREIIRLRGNQRAVTGALNELPVLFYDDEHVLALYRAFLAGGDRTSTLADIVIRMAAVAGAKNLNSSDLTRFLEVPDDVTQP